MNKLLSLLVITIVGAAAAILIMSQIEYTKQDKDPLRFDNNQPEQQSATAENVESELDATVEQEASVNAEFDALESLDF